jgi:hypothetical protein
MLTLGSIALGFVLFALYYWTSQPLVLPVGRMARRDRAADILRDLDSRTQEFIATELGRQLDLTNVMEYGKRGVFGRVFSPAYLRWPDDDEPSARSDRRRKVRTARRLYKHRWEKNEDALRAALSFVDLRTDGRVGHEYRRSMDLYHSLGTCRMAVSVAYVTVASYNVIFLTSRMTSPRSIAALVALVLPSLALWIVFHRTRARTWDAEKARLGISLRIAIGDAMRAERDVHTAAASAAPQLGNADGRARGEIE